MPVSVATAERSFSKRKIIKNYLRSTMGQNRLSNLAIISIESDLLKELDTQDSVSYTHLDVYKRQVLRLSKL